MKISLVLECLRLEMALEIVLSGLEFDLYGTDELPFVYWYAERITNRYLEISVRLASLRSSSSRFKVQISISDAEATQRILNGCAVTWVSWLLFAVLHFWRVIRHNPQAFH
jgi:hypothetical protein